MRDLAPYLNMRIRWRGTFYRYGKRKSDNQTTTLLINITAEDIFIKHFWILDEHLSNHNLKRGEIIEFTGVVRPYRKGKYGANLDFTVFHIQNVKTVGIDKKLCKIKPLPPSKRINLSQIASPKSTWPGPKK